MKTIFIRSTGNIIAEVSPHEAEQLRHGLNLLHQLHDRPDQKPFRDEIIGMSAELIESIVESRNSPEFERQVKRMIKEKTEMLESNRLTTLMFEMSSTRSGAYHRLTELLFKDNRMELPSGAVGIVKTPTEKLRVRWDRFGRCTDLNTNRLEDYDLVLRPADNPVNAEAFAESAKLALLVILICVLF